MTSHRIPRVNELIHEEISDIIQKKLRDPRVGFVTVSDVDVSKDLRYAKVFVTVYGSEKEKKESLEGLMKARGFIRREIGKTIRLRYIPEIVFKFDNSLEYANNINEILYKLKNEEEQKSEENKEKNEQEDQVIDKA